MLEYLHPLLGQKLADGRLPQRIYKDDCCEFIYTKKRTGLSSEYRRRQTYIPELQATLAELEEHTGDTIPQYTTYYEGALFLSPPLFRCYMYVLPPPQGPMTRELLTTPAFNNVTVEIIPYVPRFWSNESRCLKYRVQHDGENEDYAYRFMRLPRLSRFVLERSRTSRGPKRADGTYSRNELIGLLQEHGINFNHHSYTKNHMVDMLLRILDTYPMLEMECDKKDCRGSEWW